MKQSLQQSPHLAQRKLPTRVAVGMLAVALSPSLALAAETGQTLETVTVEGEAPVRDTYKTETTSIGKTKQQLRDIPQSITVVNQQLMQDQGVATLKDALRNVPGITFAAGEGGRSGDQVVIRGFSAATDTYRDGMRDIGQYNRDAFNDDKVEVLKGASSMLFGRGSTGGVVNQVSKSPFLGSTLEGDLTIGTNDYQRVTADINQMTGDHSAVRLNLMDTHDGSDRGAAKNERWGIAPSVAFGLGEPTTVVLSYMHQEENNVPDYGVPYNSATHEPLSVDRSKFYGFDSDYEKTSADIVTAKITHDFGNGTELSNQLRYNRFWRDVNPTAPRLVSSDTSATGLMRRSKPMRDGVDQSVNNQTDLTTRFATGDIRHTLLTGLEMTYELSDTSRYTLLNTLPTTTIGNPVSSTAYNTARYRSSNTKFQASDIALYSMDTIELTRQWKAVLGTRFDRFEGDYNVRSFNSDGSVNSSNTYDLSRTDNVWSWRSGLIWQPDMAQSYYFSYGTSFNPSGETYSLDKATAKVDPEKNRNIELGSKWDLLDGDASLRAALFRIEKTNERNTDPDDTSVVTLSGKRHTNGIELEGNGRLTERWEIFAGVTFMDSKIDKAAPGQNSTTGKMPRYTPRATGNIWTTYKFTDQITGGIGATYVGKRYANETNTLYLPSYTVANAMLSYETKHYRFQLNLNNLGNKTYYDGAYTGHATVGTPREAQLTIGLKY
ncbi:TonB-dependent siderophore receptor [Aquitalea sp. LB_tupeE]|uniref:TonB-dependent receptor n=1 Tax=Aquitalea sp. LB_tupeE TaxID=2748078 RepID=UPI0015C090E8|nr:TonB-dependent siderophore receptor [Aquitalea sp. LB_tupeE]NWK77891.1 TonB-dependent siderophore receptor [Aquitalea sp. LB_tupeE]